ncbi:hypothetical protein CW751_07560 [Brumimicrobium salinarum]|uniref:Secretion system C-terminal sorting domain-containing protein n=1 Tax=Brumimicrobium salinarum TaxID=2058658 RepID=A0A2I0R360_9FLAO|nr:T9SS type A sorting domain-containing protein [Brumimicrobium salinarum]PKR81014.1 hypothetical protein CW751_07560 [Brumimicrobium salinarum]
MKLFFLIPTFILTVFSLHSQDCSSGRYSSDLFPGSDLTSDIQYGTNLDYEGNSVDLKLDLYQPTGDTENERALIIFIHGGSFVQGSKTGNDVVPLAKFYAKKGYVTSSISYRLGMTIPPTEKDASEAVMRATQDARAAVRYFKKSVKDDGNPYGIDTTNIYLAGSSAGGFVALHLAYLDELNEVPSIIDLNDNSLSGGIEGNSGTPNHTSNVKAIVNIAGAIGDTTWMNNNSTPVLSLHGDQDETVPFGSDMLSLLIFEIMEVDGSESIHVKAEKENIKNCFKAEYGVGHVPHSSSTEYLDTVTMYMTPFLLSEVCGTAEFCVCNTPVDPTTCHPKDGTAKLDYENLNANLMMYPNPAKDKVYFTLEKSPIHTISVIDIKGRKIKQAKIANHNTTLDLTNFDSGVYFVKLTVNEQVLTRKLVVQ